MKRHLTILLLLWGMLACLGSASACPQGSLGAEPAVDAPPGLPPGFALASCSADSRLPQDPLIRPHDLFRLQQDEAWAIPQCQQLAWQAMWGDLDGDGWADYPAGIDALDLQAPPLGAPATLLDLQFSMDKDAFGFLDGDILGFDALGQPQVIIAEGTLLTALGLTDSSLDVDALCRQDDGRVWFSLKDNRTSTFLGSVLDGDILSYDPQTGIAERIFDEATVQAWVSHARGSSVAFGDLKALARHPYSHALLFTIQSPSSDDASVFTDLGGGHVLAGWGEEDWGFEVSTELDALTFPSVWWDAVPQLSTDVTHLPPSQPFQLRIHHATPFALLRGRASGTLGLRRSSRGGFGLSLPAWSASAFSWPLAGEYPVTSDGSGSAQHDGLTPPLAAGVLSQRFYYQMWDLGGGGLSSPLSLVIE